MTDEHPTIPLDFDRLSADEMRRRAKAFYERMAPRRSVRAFSDEPVPLEVIRRAVATRPYLLIPVGYPAEGCEVPDIRKKDLGEILVEK